MVMAMMVISTDEPPDSAMRASHISSRPSVNILVIYHLQRLLLYNLNIFSELFIDLTGLAFLLLVKISLFVLSFKSGINSSHISFNSFGMLLG